MLVQGLGISLEPPEPRSGLAGGCFSIQGPKVTRGPEGGSLTVECRYTRGWETNRKWWCRGADWYDCQILIQTTPRQQTVQGPRLSISDNQRDRVISVTMRDLRRDDQDTYWCGIHRFGTDRGAPIQVIVVGPGENSLIATPRPWCSGCQSGGACSSFQGQQGNGRVPENPCVRASERQADGQTDGRGGK
ncbi:hypothetical protein QTO34_008805 [Cnephaeus nilssonii]|uniref:Immunoglobulin domain-containing protein n=1 Tax=Cnephaeus nilssonii TaxID=3371016 RepID=A0AA40HGT4_CNENI|nr:hypothetical protein QTO34_008805 [Eptesicus nilssonii]